jgi:nucleoside-diphosphate-sugar epimerase
MNVFILGATGYIGQAVTERLQRAGHTVTALVRDLTAAERLTAQGVAVVRGELKDTALLREAAANSEAVIQLAQPRFDFTKSFETQMQQAGSLLLEATRALLDGLGGTGKTLILTGGTGAYGNTGAHVATEETPISDKPFVRDFTAMEQLVLRSKNVRGVVVRPAIVYGRGGGPAAMQFEMGARYGRLMQIGDGANPLSWVHLDDLADLYLLLLERATPGLLVNAVNPPFVTQRQLLQTVSDRLGFGGRVTQMPAFLARRMADNNLFARTMRVSSDRARALGWTPTRPGLLEALHSPEYDRLAARLKARRARPTLLGVMQPFAVAAGVAGFVNAVLFAAASALGAFGPNVVVPASGQPIGIASVVFSTVVGVGLGGAAFALIGRALRTPFPTFAGLAGVVLLLSLATPFSISGATAGMLLTLEAMHVVAAGGAVWAARRAPRSGA